MWRDGVQIAIHYTVFCSFKLIICGIRLAESGGIAQEFRIFTGGEITEKIFFSRKDRQSEDNGKNRVFTGTPGTSPRESLAG